MVSIEKWLISPTRYKKYRVILSNGQVVDFGDIRYQHYKDSSPLQAYAHMNHGDKKRRELYYARHNMNYPKYSADWLAKKYLW